jgi:tetratricopeptide (TPR) repeat protein
MGRLVLPVLMLSSLMFAASPVEQARDLYARTEYGRSLESLQSLGQKDAAALQLIGQNQYMLGEYKKATEAFQKAAALDPDNSEIYHWLGRAYGRRAETGGPFFAAGYAGKARQAFEKAVALDRSNKEAVNDLFDYYLQAPGFLGGGVQKAEGLVSLIAKNDPAEGNFAQAQLDDKRKEYNDAEAHLERAILLAPRQVGRVLDLAKYLAKRGRIVESDALFTQAMTMAPDNPKVLYSRAETYIQEHRNLDQARQLLQQYLNSPLTADDPPRTDAEALLRKTGV